MTRLIPFHYETAKLHPDRIRKVSDPSIKYVACGLDSYNGRFYFERENSIVDVCHVLNMSSRTWSLIEEIPDTPMNQPFTNTTEPSVPFNLDEAIEDPSRVRQVNNWERRFVEVIRTQRGRGLCECLLVADNGFTHPCDTNGRSVGKRYVLTPKPQKMKTVSKTIDDLPKRPFWRKLSNGKVATSFRSNDIAMYIRNNVTYSETLNGPWLPFTKEVECE